MAVIDVSDQTFSKLQADAVANGFSSVTEYLDDLYAGESFDPDKFFTPERIAECERALEEMDRTGKAYTFEDLEKQAVARRRAFEQNRPK